MTLVVDNTGAFRADDLAETPDDGRRYEVIEGMLVVNPAPIPMHQLVVLHIYRILYAAVAGTDRLVFVAPVQLRINDLTGLEPDVVVLPRSSVARERLGLPVDLVVEVLSPSTARKDRLLKSAVYAEAGIAQYWIVGPITRAIERRRLVDGRYVVDRGEAAAVAGVAIPGSALVAWEPAVT